MLIDKDNDMNINHNRNNISMRFKDFLKDFFEYVEQQSIDRHVVPLGLIILIPRQPVFARTP
jgi:hypothetical protein